MLILALLPWRAYDGIQWSTLCHCGNELGKGEAIQGNVVEE